MYVYLCMYVCVCKYIYIILYMHTDVGKDVEKLEMLLLLLGMYSSAATMENRMEMPQKNKHRTTI